MKGRQLRLIGGRKLQSPKGLSTRPTTNLVRESVLNILSTRLKDCQWLDICSGSGVMSCEVLQFGARKIIAVEKDLETAEICKSNLFLVKGNFYEKCYFEVLRCEAVGWLRQGFEEFSKKHKQFCVTDSFDFAYLDPPYNSGLYLPLLNALLEGNWLSDKGLVICEHHSSKPLYPPKGWKEFARKKYGKTSILLLSPQEVHHDDTGSMPLQKGQAM